MRAANDTSRLIAPHERRRRPPQAQPAKTALFAGGLRVMSAEIAGSNFSQMDYGLSFSIRYIRRMTLSRRAVLGGAVAAATVASTTVAAAAAEKGTGLKPM